MSDETLILDPLPTALQAALENQTRLVASQQSDRMQLEFVIETLLRWDPGDTVTVAFLGGTPALHKKIADAALEWAKFGNVKLDFGESNGSFRTWSPNDTSYSADIRIGFDRVFQPGYWSLVGRNSVEPNIVGPGGASMNFSNFDLHLPPDYAATVMHEFGHALGFQHEHAHPTGGCDNEFRWTDDPGYQRTTDSMGQFIADAQGRQPGIYTVLAGPPNRWPQAKVDHNLRQLPNSNAFMLGPFDKLSIMKYHFPEWMFVRGKDSVCYSGRNLNLSAGDIKGVSLAYPFPDLDVQAMATRREQALQRTLTAAEATSHAQAAAMPAGDEYDLESAPAPRRPGEAGAAVATPQSAETLRDILQRRLNAYKKKK